MNKTILLRLKLQPREKKGKILTAEAAVTKLLFLLGQGLSPDHLKFCPNKNLRGEISE